MFFLNFIINKIQKLFFLIKPKFINYYLFFKKIYHFSFFNSNKKKKKKLFFAKRTSNNYLIYKKNQFNFFFKLIFPIFWKNNLIFFFFNFFWIKNIFFLCVNFVLKIRIILFKTFGDGFTFLKGLFLIFFIDSLVTDDEPLWEPLEWSLFQTWLLFIFIFAWIAENLITSRFGSYVGRDKRVWLAWYKSFWLIELSYVVSYGLAALFVIVPFYYELTYNITFIFAWWTWYTKVFFFKFISIYTIILLLSNYFLLNIKWLNWKKLLFLIFLIFFFLMYLLYTQFIITFFSYFTDPLWYQKTRFIDYIQLSHEPLKWGWGSLKRDHFTYHKVSTVFWFKNDAPFAGAFLMFNLFFFLCLFFLALYWVVLFRKTYTINEVSFTFAVYCVSSLKQFFFFFLLLFFLIFISFIMAYWRFPIEFIWIKNTNSWINHFTVVFGDYIILIFKLFF